MLVLKGGECHDLVVTVVGLGLSEKLVRALPSATDPVACPAI
jgi:hypothetical protein